MNCCNEYGECKQGHGCPVRQACELPELRYTQRPAKRSLPTWLMDLVACAVAVIAIAWLLGCYGPSLDAPPDSPVVTDAQAAAMHEYMQELAVAKACRMEHGESLMRRAVDGSFVCIPRKHFASK